MAAVLTAKEHLLAAWKRGAPQADTSRGWPRGFWQDVALIAVQNALGEEITIRQTMCVRGSSPEPKVRSKLGVDLNKLEINL